mgnify:CR=1 FL=1
MQDFEAGAPPPPAMPPPPPPPKTPAPGVGPAATPAASEPNRDNPIALAGLVISILALILSVIVVGFFIAIASFVLCVIGLRRARGGLRGRGIAAVGLGLSVLAMAFSVIGLLFLLSFVRSLGEDTIRDGIATRSTNTEHPPQDDLDGVECSTSNTGLVARAEFTITNRSDSSSVYQITVVWDTASGIIEEEVSTGYLSPDRSTTLTAVDLTGNADPDSCRISRIERSILPFF